MTLAVASHGLDVMRGIVVLQDVRAHSDQSAKLHLCKLQNRPFVYKM